MIQIQVERNDSGVHERRWDRHENAKHGHDFKRLLHQRIWFLSVFADPPVDER